MVECERCDGEVDLHIKAPAFWTQPPDGADLCWDCFRESVWWHRYDVCKLDYDSTTAKERYFVSPRDLSIILPETVLEERERGNRITRKGTRE